MKKYFTALLVSSLMLVASVSFAQTSTLQGTWVLQEVELKFTSSTGGKIDEPYYDTPEKFWNTTDCIFPTLEIKENQCDFNLDNIVSTRFTCENGKLTLWFTTPVEFNYTLSGNTLTLDRQYVGRNEYEAHLVYTKR